MAQKMERIHTLGCGGLSRLAMELDKGDSTHEPKVVLDATDGKKDAKHGEAHVRISLAESTCRKLAKMLTDFADKLAAAREGKKVADDTAKPAVVESAETKKDSTSEPMTGI